MAAIQYYDVILKPVITEKSMAGMSEKKYTFFVHPEANKSMIKEAVEKMFEGTKVAKVNTINMDGGEKTRHDIRKDRKDQKGNRLADRRQQRNRNLHRPIIRPRDVLNCQRTAVKNN